MNLSDANISLQASKMRLSFQKLEHMNSRYKLYSVFCTYEEKPIERVFIERVGWDTSPRITAQGDFASFSGGGKSLEKKVWTANTG